MNEERCRESKMERTDRIENTEREGIQIEEILNKASQAGASDVHLTTGIEPRMRQNGNLTALPFRCLTAQDTMAVAHRIMNDEQFRLFEERGEYDMSFSQPQGERYRVNIFRQQGGAGAGVPSDILTDTFAGGAWRTGFDHRPVPEKEGARTGNGTHRKRKINDPGGYY